MHPTSRPPTPAIGPSTLGAAVTALVSLVLAVVGFVQGDRTPETLGAFTAGVVALVSLVASRTSQAQLLSELSAAASRPVVQVGSSHASNGSGTTVTLAQAVEAAVDRAQEQGSPYLKESGLVHIEVDGSSPPDEADLSAEQAREAEAGRDGIVARADAELTDQEIGSRDHADVDGTALDGDDAIEEDERR